MSSRRRHRRRRTGALIADSRPLRGLPLVSAARVDELIAGRVADTRQYRRAAIIGRYATPNPDNPRQPLRCQEGSRGPVFATEKAARDCAVYLFGDGFDVMRVVECSAGEHWHLAR